MHFKLPDQAWQPTFASGKPDDTGREETGTDRQYDGKKGVRLCLYKCRGSEVEKGPAWAGQARVCRGKHERDSPYPLHA